MERMAGKAIRRSTNADRRSASRWIAVAIATVTMLVLTTGGASAQTAVGSCQTIASPGTYQLSGDLSGTGTCLSVDAAGVTIDGNGHTITADTGLVAGELTNFTVRDLTVDATNRGMAIGLVAGEIVVEDNHIDGGNRGLVLGTISDPATVTVRNNDISGTQAVRIEDTVDPHVVTLSRNALRGDYGVYYLRDNAFVGGTSHDSPGGVAVVDARNNYWNASDGPASVPGGLVGPIATIGPIDLDLGQEILDGATMLPLGIGVPAPLGYGGPTPPYFDPFTDDTADGSGSAVTPSTFPPYSNVRFSPFLSTDPTTGGGDANEPPVAAFGLTPSDPVPGDRVTIDGGDSTDDDGSITSYFWRISGPDDITFQQGETASVSVQDEGFLDVRLIVEDDDGDTGMAARTLSVDSPETEEGNQTDEDDESLDVGGNDSETVSQGDDPADGGSGNESQDDDSGAEDERTQTVASPDGDGGNGSVDDSGDDTAEGDDAGDGESDAGQGLPGFTAVVAAIAAASAVALHRRR